MKCIYCHKRIEDSIRHFHVIDFVPGKQSVWRYLCSLDCLSKWVKGVKQ